MSTNIQKAVEKIKAEIAVADMYGHAGVVARLTEVLALLEPESPDTEQQEPKL